MARVLKPPSQMLGLEFGLEGLAPCGGRWGLAWRSCLRGSEGGWKRGGGTVGGGLVGCGALSGGPKKTTTQCILSVFCFIPLCQNFWKISFFFFSFICRTLSIEFFDRCTFYFGTENASFFFFGLVLVDSRCFESTDWLPSLTADKCCLLALNPIWLMQQHFNKQVTKLQCFTIYTVLLYGFSEVLEQNKAQVSLFRVLWDSISCYCGKLP